MKQISALAGLLAARWRERLRSLAAIRPGLGARLLAGVLLVSGFVTLVLTAIHLYLDYRRDVSDIERRLNQIGGSYLGSVAESLWAIDEKQLRLQLEGILRLPDIRAVEVREAGATGSPPVVRLSRSPESSAFAREYPLHHEVRGEDRVIGTLHVEATLANIYRRLRSTALTILVTQAAQIFLVSLFILYIFHSLVTRHLSAIAAHVGGYRINDPPSEFRLRRRPPRHEDELQQVITTFNTLSQDLHIAYRNLADVNDQLAQDVAARRQAEAVLREREARIRRLVDANIIGIFIWDLDGRILEANDAFLRMMGYDRDDLIAGRIRWSDLTPPEWRDRDAQAIEVVKTTGAVQPAEKEYLRKDGSRVPVLHGSAIFEEGGDQGVAFVLDLTERRRAEEALRATENRFRDYVDVASDWFWETGSDHRFTEFSRSAADWGLSQILIGKKRWDLAADREEEPEKWRIHMATLEARQPFRGFRYKIPHPDGSARYVSVGGKPVFDGSGAFLGYRGVATDVSAEVRAEKALRESEERFRTLMQFSFDVYWETDAQHRFIRQDYSERVTDGPLPGSELGKRRWELPYLDIDEDAWRKHREMLDAHLPFRDLEYGRPTPSGGKRYAAVSGLPMFDEAGRFIGYRGVGRHITERKRAQARQAAQYGIARVLAESDSLEAAAPDLLRTICEKMDWDWGALWSVDQRAGRLRCDCIWHGSDTDSGEFDAVSREMTWAPGRGRVGQVWQSGQSLRIADVAKDPGFERGWAAVRAGLRAGLACPILLGPEVLGVVEFFSRMTREPDEQELATLSAIGSQVGQFIQRKRAEQAVQASEKRFRALIEHAYDVVLLVSAEPTVLYASPSVETVLGYTPEELIGRNSFDLVHPDHLQDSVSRFARSMKQPGAVVTGERLLVHKDGSSRWVENVLVNLLSEPSVQAFVMHLRDVTERKRSEEALRESEREVRTIVETIPAMIVTIAADGRDAFIGKRFSEYSGLSEKEARGSGWKAAVHPDDLDLYLREWRASLKSGNPVEFETRVRRADGKYRWFLIRAVAQRDEAGNILKWYALLTDIDDLKRAEAVLREREMRIRGLVDANIIGVFTWRRDEAGGAVFRAVFRDVNDAFLRIVGYDREDLVAGSVWILTPPDWEDRTQRAMAEMKLNGSFQPYEKEYIRKDGSRVPVLVGAAQTDDAAEEGVAFVLDLTEQKQTEAALRESEEQWKAVFENNPVMYFMVDEAGTIISVNPFGAEQLGYRVDELVGRPVQSVFHQADRGAVQRNAAICFERPGQALSWELRKVRKNGEVIWVRETARASLIKDRPVLLIVCEDITEGKRTAEALREVQAELAHANRVAALGQLTASIAHEVNQPVTGVLSSALAAVRWLEGQNLDAARQAMDRVVRDATRAGDVIRGIRAFINKAPPRTGSFDMNEAIHEVIDLTHDEAAKNSVSVEAQLAKNLPVIQGDRVQLQQVVLNLVINAIEAMTEPGDRSRDLLITTRTAGPDAVRVAVQDTGPGLDASDPERLFEAFYTTKPGGLGMGLSICRSIVEAHGGRLSAAANAPHGTIFQFTVPVRGGDSEP
ncbi:MAG TPA: PAS domain S-box protein [Bradyrhizobium sp.]|nr:PAS domain S-box protein [Bradyrhizobium sp.]